MAGKTAKGESTRRDILRVASDVFAQHGYAGTRMDDVIRASGLTKGALYFHFSSKAELAHAVVSDHKDRWLDLTRQELSQHTEPTAQLRAVGALLIRMSAGDASSWAAVRLAGQIRSDAPESGAEADKPLMDWVSLIAQIVVDGQQTGAFSADLDPEDSAIIAVSAFDGLKSVSDALGASTIDFTRRAEHLIAIIESSFSVRS